MARVAVFSLGGTIAMTSDRPCGSGGPGGSDGVVPALSGEQLLAAVPGLSASGIEVEVHDVARLPSASLGLADIVRLSVLVSERIAAGADGAVVTQGTDTIEETAYLLDLLHDGDAPVVVTGAMRNPDMAGPDGPANLLDAVVAAGSPAVRGLGCVVVFAGQIHAARFARKTHATSVAAFSSPNNGPVGHVAEGSPRVLVRLPRQATVPWPDPSRNPAVPVVPAVLGDDGSLLRLLDGGIAGLVVAGFGAGHVPESMAGPLAALAARVPVVLASRTAAGPVLTRTYGFPGSESDLLGRGLISAGMLDPYKARILLWLLLASGADRGTVAWTFAGAAAGGS